MYFPPSHPALRLPDTLKLYETKRSRCQLHSWSSSFAGAGVEGVAGFRAQGLDLLAHEPSEALKDSYGYVGEGLVHKQNSADVRFTTSTSEHSEADKEGESIPAFTVHS